MGPSRSTTTGPCGPEGAPQAPRAAVFEREVGRTRQSALMRPDTGAIRACRTPLAPDPGDLQTALSSVARAIADSLELTEVWGRVADACRAVVPFDGMGVSRLEPGDRVRIAVAAGDPAAQGLQERIFARSDFSPRNWPRESFLVLIGDAALESLDPSAVHHFARALDPRLRKGGARRAGARRLGGKTPTATSRRRYPGSRRDRSC